MPRVFKPLAPADPQSPISKTPPSDLGPEGRRLWRTVAPLPWVGRSDSMALHYLCRDADLAAVLRADIEATGAAYEARGRHWTNPSVGMLLDVQKRLSDGLRAFGADPASRGRLGVAERRPASKMELLEERRRQRDQERGRARPPSA